MATNLSFGLRTTFGAYAFENATTPYDAFVVAKTREAGLIILGKTNLAVIHSRLKYQYPLANVY